MKLDINKKIENFKIGEVEINSANVYLIQKNKMSEIFFSVGEDEDKQKDIQNIVLKEVIFSGWFRNLLIENIVKGDLTVIHELDNLQLQNAADMIFEAGSKVDQLGF